MKLIIISTLMFASLSAFSQTNNIQVNQQRIGNRILELSKFGKDALGRGYRVAYTKGDIEGRIWFIDLMKKAGLEVSIDYAGNIIGKRKRKRSVTKTYSIRVTY